MFAQKRLSLSQQPFTAPQLRVAAVGLLLVLLVSGCTVARQQSIADQAIQMNKELAETNNRTILLNVLRAATYQPLYFSTVSTLDSRSAGDSELGFDIPFMDIKRGGSFSPIFNIEDRTPRFSVSPTNTASFYRDMANPLELGIIEYMLSQPYPDELALMLSIDKIGWGGSLSVNDPASAGYPEFLHKLRLLLVLGISIEPLLGDNTLIEDLEQDEALKLIEERGVGGPRLQIVPDRKTGKFDVIGEPGGFRLCFRQPPILNMAQLTDKQVARAVELTCRSWVASHLGGAQLGGRDLKRLTVAEKVRVAEASFGAIQELQARVGRIVAQLGAPVGLSAEVFARGLLAQSETGDEDGVGEQELGRLEHFGELALVMRSPLEIYQYLGALVRLNELQNRALAIYPDRLYDGGYDCSRSDCEPANLFLLRRDGRADGGVSVNYAGSDWSVAEPSLRQRDYSSDTLSILSSFTALFSEADDVGSVARVTVLP